MIADPCHVNNISINDEKINPFQDSLPLSIVHARGTRGAVQQNLHSERTCPLGPQAPLGLNGSYIMNQNVSFQVEKSTYIARLAGLLTGSWSYNRMVIENTQFEFPGFSINVPRIFQGPLSVRHSNQPTYLLVPTYIPYPSPPTPLPRVDIIFSFAPSSLIYEYVKSYDL